jgi:tetratricopeptide (TPR) repeat protein
MLSRIYLSQGNNEKAVEMARSAAARSKFSASRYAELASAYQSSGRFEEAVSYARKAVSLAPFQVQWYENLSRTAFVAGYMKLNAKEPEKARPFFEDAAAVPKEIAERMAKVTPQERRLWVVAPLMDVTPPIQINAGGAFCFLGQFPESQKRLGTALKEIEEDGISEQEKEMYAECCLWLAVLSDKQGNAALKRQYLEKGKNAVPAVEEWYKHIAELPALK